MQENNETKLIAAEVYEMVATNTIFNGSETTETKWSMDVGKWFFLLVFCSLQIFIRSIANFVVIATIFVSKQLRRRSEDRLVLNLAIINFFSLIIVLPSHMYNFNQWKNRPTVIGNNCCGYPAYIL